MIDIEKVSEDGGFMERINEHCSFILQCAKNTS